MRIGSAGTVLLAVLWLGAWGATAVLDHAGTRAVPVALHLTLPVVAGALIAWQQEAFTAAALFDSGAAGLLVIEIDFGLAVLGEAATLRLPPMLGSQVEALAGQEVWTAAAATWSQWAMFLAAIGFTLGGAGGTVGLAGGSVRRRQARSR